MELRVAALVRHAATRKKGLLFGALAAALASFAFPNVDAHAPSRRAAIARSLTSDGYVLADDDVFFLRQYRDRLPPFRESPVLVRAKRGGDPWDLFLVYARLSPEGVVLSLSSPLPLTKTQGVEESRPEIIGEGLVAYTTTLDGTTTGVHVLDLEGPAPSSYTEFSQLQRFQTAITNAQETGQTRGIGHFAFLLDPPAERVSLKENDDGSLTISADGHDIRVDPKTGAILEGGAFAHPNHEEVARPSGFIQWSVNRVRAVPWFGEERMQYVKAIAFTAKDWLERTFGSHTAPSDKEIQDELGDLNGGGVVSASYTNPEIGWPPAPLKPIFKNVVAGEGAWIPLDKDPFLKHPKDLPPPFVTTFIRTDRERPDTRVFITMWDPRQIALHMEAGTVEPTSATGSAGPGIIPRRPEVLKRAVAGFNGGFQAMHGEYGMMAQGTVYLPPKPYAATVFEMRDGSTAMGTWPRSAEIPSDVLSYRQNMTALVEKGKFNPWGRTWWGGTPETWTDRIHTTRSGICLTKEHFVGYFWGSSISHEVLAQAMLAAGCDYGIHLDMNPGLAGFELYNIGTTDEVPPLGRPLQKDWEYEGGFKELPELRVRARRMIKAMSHVNFPAWIHRNGRDFFYLTERELLPGADIAGAPSGEGKWIVKGLPQHGFPYAIATTTFTGKAAKSAYRILDLDPRMVKEAEGDAPVVVSFARNVIANDAGPHGSASAPPSTSAHRPHEAKGSGAARYLTFRAGAFELTRERVGAIVAEGIAVDASVKGTSLACVGEGDGMLHWIEAASREEATKEATAEMDGVLARLGCSDRAVVDRRALLGGEATLFGTKPPRAPDHVIAFARGAPPSAHLTFEDTAMVPFNVWHTLQAQRVRYFPKPKKPSPSGSSSGGLEPPPKPEPKPGRTP